MGNNLFVEEYGQGERVVVMLHGAPSPPSHFRAFARALGAARRVLVVHLPGYGESPVPVGAYDFEATLAQTELALREHDVQEADWIGFSAGGWRALAHGLRGSIRTRRIVLLAGVAAFPQQNRDGFRQLAAFVRSGGDASATAVALFLSPGFAASHPAAAADVAQWPRATSASNLATELEALAALPDLLPSLDRLGCPVLARVGVLDQATPLAWSADIVKQLPHARLDAVPDAGHALLWEDFEGTLAATVAWLDGDTPA